MSDCKEEINYKNLFKELEAAAAHHDDSPLAAIYAIKTLQQQLTKSEERVKEFEERLADARKTAADFYYDECIACEIEPDEGIYEGFKGLNI